MQRSSSSSFSSSIFSYVSEDEDEDDHEDDSKRHQVLIAHQIASPKISFFSARLIAR
jgi:hypothetical protein